jgi:hypothetical protein
MNTKITLRSICGTVALLCFAGASHALSLGPVSGPTVIGRPLAVSAPIQFDDLAQGVGTGCISAEVLYGDKVVDARNIQLSLVPDAARQVSIARISSAAVVDEPVVTLVLRAGCGRQSTRRYVLLAEAPAEEPMVLGASASLAPAVMGAPATSQVGLAQTPTPRQAQRATSSGPARSVAFKPAARLARAAPPDAVLRPAARLQLGVWEPQSDKSPWLRVSDQLGSMPSSDSGHRAAAAALWRALNAQPQDLLRTADRLRALEGEVSSLRSLAARHRTDISSTREALQAAKSQSSTNLVLAAFLALLAGGSAAFFWNRTRRAEPLKGYAAWYPEPEAPANGSVEEVAAPPGVPEQAAAIDPAAVQAEPMKETSVLQVAEPAAAPAAPLLEFSFPELVEPPAISRVEERRPGLKVDALHGAQQQSEFFSSLGQYDEAIAVLSGYIDESSEKPVLAFLELFRIYRALGMRMEYEELQSRFRRAFGLDFTSFSEFKDERRELEMYPIAMARITASWPSPEGQDIIEELLFKKPSSARDLLSMEACRELVWLYSLGQEIIHSTGAPAGLQLRVDRGLSNNHFILPWAIGHEDGGNELSLDRLDTIDVAPASSAFGVDIDLTAVPGEALQQSWNDAPKLPESRPAAATVAAETAEMFDAVMESESRKLFR